MRKPNKILIFGMAVLSITSWSQAQEYRTPPDHPIGYLVSLPKGWQKGHPYPVLVAISGAERDFKSTLAAFSAVPSPFIVVVPFVTTNGGPGYRQAEEYRYSEPTWARIAQDRWKFDREGIAAAVRDVHHTFGGEPNFFLTGFEAGGHTAWAVAFNHPDELRAVAPVAPNYAGRHIAFSNWPHRADLPIKIFVGADDNLWKPNVLAAQYKAAQSDAAAHGFRVSLETIPGKGHVWLAREVCDWFSGLLSRQGH